MKVEFASFVKDAHFHQDTQKKTSQEIVFVLAKAVDYLYVQRG